MICVPAELLRKGQPPSKVKVCITHDWQNVRNEVVYLPNLDMPLPMNAIAILASAMGYMGPKTRVKERIKVVHNGRCIDLMQFERMLGLETACSNRCPALINAILAEHCRAPPAELVTGAGDVQRGSFVWARLEGGFHSLCVVVEASSRLKLARLDTTDPTLIDDVAPSSVSLAAAPAAAAASSPQPTPGSTRTERSTDRVMVLGVTLFDGKLPATLHLTVAEDGVVTAEHFRLPGLDLLLPKSALTHVVRAVGYLRETSQIKALRVVSIDGEPCTNTPMDEVLKVLGLAFLHGGCRHSTAAYIAEHFVSFEVPTASAEGSIDRGCFVWAQVPEGHHVLCFVAHAAPDRQQLMLIRLDQSAKMQLVVPAASVILRALAIPHLATTVDGSMRRKRKRSEDPIDRLAEMLDDDEAVATTIIDEVATTYDAP